MTSRDVLEKLLPVIDSFLERVREAGGQRGRDAALQDIRPLTSMLRAFYVAFLREAFGLRVQGFSYKDKRIVSRRLIKEEDEATSRLDDHGLETRLEAAARFEDLSNLLHSEEDGYTDADYDYTIFHSDAFPGWLETVERWLQATTCQGDTELADAIRERRSSYEDVIATSYR